MAVDVIMPKLGESITEATIIEWKKNIGDSVNRDETILEISTDKVDSEVPSPASGTLIEIFFQKNDTVEVGEVIARIGNDNEKKHSVKEVTKEDVAVSKKTSDFDNKTGEKKDINNTNNTSLIKFYSPLVKSIAKKENISLNELDNLEGTGYNGRVNKNDILQFIKSKKGIELKHKDIDRSIETLDQSNYLEDKIEPMDHVRKMIAQHMIKSRDTSVHVYSSSEVDMTSIVNFKNEYKNLFKNKYGASLTYTPFILDGVIKAIHEYPRINSCLEGDNIKYHQNINMGVAVALANDNLIVPVIKRSEELNFLGLARSTSDLALRSRGGKLNPEEAQGSTFTVTNPGVFGSLFGMGIINQPNVAILSVGSIHKRPVVKETEYGDVVIIRSMMYLTLAYDHRIIDGAYGTKFLNKIKLILESFTKNEIKI